MLGTSLALAEGCVGWPDDTKVIDVSASAGIIHVIGQDEGDALYTLAIPESLAHSLKVQAMPKGPLIAMKGFFDWPSDTQDHRCCSRWRGIVRGGPGRQRCAVYRAHHRR